MFAEPSRFGLLSFLRHSNFRKFMKFPLNNIEILTLCILVKYWDILGQRGLRWNFCDQNSNLRARERNPSDSFLDRTYTKAFQHHNVCRTLPGRITKLLATSEFLKIHEISFKLHRNPYFDSKEASDEMFGYFWVQTGFCEFSEPRTRTSGPESEIHLIVFQTRPI